MQKEKKKKTGKMNLNIGTVGFQNSFEFQHLEEVLEKGKVIFKKGLQSYP